MKHRKKKKDSGLRYALTVGGEPVIVGVKTMKFKEWLKEWTAAQKKS